MQSNLLRRFVEPAGLSIKSNCGYLTQVRNHVKMYAWRHNRSNPESYLETTSTAYTDRHNINEFTKKRQRKDWQRVIPKEKDNRFNAYKWNESYRSQPEEAKKIAASRMARFERSLMDRGNPRETDPYDPPENVEEKILALYRSLHLEGGTTDDKQASQGSKNKNISDEEVLNVDLDRARELKINLLKICMVEFKHELPTPFLNDIQSIRDLVSYYSTPVRGVNPYTDLLRKDNSLPANLSLVAEPIRYNKDSDTMFGGISAYPGMVSRVPGLRASKKYPVFNQDEFQWPDI